MIKVKETQNTLKIYLFGIRIFKHKKKIQNCEIIINKDYGRIYNPVYEQSMAFIGSKPDIYNKDGDKMDMFFLRDVHTGCHPYNYTSKHFVWDRYNVGLDTHFYTHNCMLEQMGRPTRKFGWFIESEKIVPKDYKIFDKNPGLHRDFDAILTYSDVILDKIDNAIFLPYCAQIWYGMERGGGIITEDAYKNKTKNVSIVSANKTMCDLHNYRIYLARKCKSDGLADVYGTVDGGAYCMAADALTDYRYSIIIENDVSDYFFTEKITNCFISQTIPIYLGARKIENFFNTDGIIQMSQGDDIEKILKSCNETDYMGRLAAIKDNFHRAFKYLNMDNYLYDLINNKGA